MSESARTTNVVYLLFEEVTQLDSTGPAQFLARLLAHEYDPAPPFDCGRPDRAPEHLVTQLQARWYESASSRMAEALQRTRSD